MTDEAWPFDGYTAQATNNGVVFYASYGEPQCTFFVDHSSNAGLIVGICIGVIVVLGAAIGGFLYWRKRRAYSAV